MFGNLVTNKQLKLLIGVKEIQIEPFRDENLKSTHYTLNIGRILKHDPDGELDSLHSFIDNRKPKPYELKGGQYIVVEAAQRITLAHPGIVGRFIAPSTFIEAGLGLIAGQISNRYGSGGEKIRFGIKNLTDQSFFLDETFRVAHIEFFDLRGITMDEVPLSEKEVLVWARRLARAMNDGITYPDHD